MGMSVGNQLPRSAPGAGGGGSSADDQMLIAAIRRRLLAEIEHGGGGRRHGGGDASTITNNVYGGGGFGPGVQGAMAKGDGGEGDDSDYFVDILRETIPENGSAILRDPETGEKQTRFLPKGGWHKNVHRYKKKRAAP